MSILFCLKWLILIFFSSFWVNKLARASLQTRRKPTILMHLILPLHTCIILWTKYILNNLPFSGIKIRRHYFAYVHFVFRQYFLERRQIAHISDTLSTYCRSLVHVFVDYKIVKSQGSFHNVFCGFQLTI